MNIELLVITCQRCLKSWTPRKADVRACPKCKSIYFDRPRKQKRGIDNDKRNRDGTEI